MQIMSSRVELTQTSLEQHRRREAKELLNIQKLLTSGEVLALPGTCSSELSQSIDLRVERGESRFLGALKMRKFTAAPRDSKWLQVETRISFQRMAITWRFEKKKIFSLGKHGKWSKARTQTSDEEREIRVLSSASSSMMLFSSLKLRAHRNLSGFRSESIHLTQSLRSPRRPKAFNLTNFGKVGI